MIVSKPVEPAPVDERLAKVKDPAVRAVLAEMLAQ